MDLVEQLPRLFDEHSDPERAAKMSAYMRGLFPFYGIPSPLRKTLFGEVFKANRRPDKIEAMQIALVWFSEEKRELHYCAMELLYKYVRVLHEQDLLLLEDLVVHGAWWDTVDFIGPKLIGPILKDHASLRQEWAWKWAQSEDLWLKRTSLLFQLNYKHETDIELLRSMVEVHKDHPDFFIRKAIGWILRQYAKSNPQLVMEWIKEIELSPLSLKEAQKHL